MNMKRLFNKQRGDTIIEVFLAMAVIGLSLGISYGIANRATLTGRLAQERTEAVKIAEQHLEFMKAFINSGERTRDEYKVPERFCVTESDSFAHTSGTDTQCTRGFYTSYTTYDSAEDAFTVTVEWEVPQTIEPAIVEMIYRP